jgi:2-oxoglutarate ferredoxin oxidoreductase subunit alpha
MRTLIISEGNINPEKFISILCFDGSPITANFISESIIEILSDKNISQASEEIK